MSNKNEFYGNQPVVRPLEEVVSIPNPLYKSLRGIYFIGQTPSLFVSKNSNAWAALVNPRNSGKNLFVNVLTMSNNSSSIITAELWLNTKPPGNPAVSSSVSPSNTALYSQPSPKVLIEYVQSTSEVTSGGVNIYDRIIPSNTTIVSEEDGKIIVPPGGNALVFLKSSSNEVINAIVAFGWWEQ